MSGSISSGSFSIICYYNLLFRILQFIFQTDHQLSLQTQGSLTLNTRLWKGFFGLMIVLSVLTFERAMETKVDWGMIHVRDECPSSFQCYLVLPWVWLPVLCFGVPAL